MEKAAIHIVGNVQQLISYLGNRFDTKNIERIYGRDKLLAPFLKNIISGDNSRLPSFWSSPRCNKIT